LRFLKVFKNLNKKLSYRRETARQLPTWKGARPSSPLPPLATPKRMVESETRNKRTSSVLCRPCVVVMCN